MTYSKGRGQNKDKLDYWICENCGRRHDLIDAVPISHPWQYSVTAFKCPGCEVNNSAADVIKRYRTEQGIRERWSEVEKIQKTLDLHGIHLNDITNQLIRIEQLLQKLEGK